MSAVGRIGGSADGWVDNGNDERDEWMASMDT